MSWILVIYVYAGMMAKGDSVTIATIPMQSEAACKEAGQKSMPLVSGSTKDLRYVCLHQGVAK